MDLAGDDRIGSDSEPLNEHHSIAEGEREHHCLTSNSISGDSEPKEGSLMQYR